jgi:hypothetical protein
MNGGTSQSARRRASGAICTGPGHSHDCGDYREPMICRRQPRHVGLGRRTRSMRGMSGSGVWFVPDLVGEPFTFTIHSTETHGDFHRTTQTKLCRPCRQGQLAVLLSDKAISPTDGEQRTTAGPELSEVTETPFSRHFIRQAGASSMRGQTYAWLLEAGSYSAAYSFFAATSMGKSASAFFQASNSASYAFFASALSPAIAYARASPSCATG